MSATEPSDSDLVAAYRSGDIGALETLVARHGGSLMSYLRGSAGNAEDARDGYQETWRRVIRHIDGYRSGNFRAWLTTIARHWLIDSARRRRPTASLDAAEAEGATWHRRLAGREPPPSAGLVAEDVLRGVARLVAMLPPEQREVFLMRTQQELSFAEIARILKVPLNTALGRMHYAVTKLRRGLEMDHDR